MARKPITPPHTPSILIAGAGLAGLTAAFELQRNGADVTVVEAQDRIGGRVLTIREGFVEGQHAEAGGDLIDEGQDAIVQLSKSLGLKLVSILKDGFGFVSGKTSTIPKSSRVPHPSAPSGRSRSLAAPWELLARKLEPRLQTYRVAEERWDGVIARALAERSVDDWLNEIDADRRLRAFVRGLRGFFLADPEQLSLLALVDQLADGTPGQNKMYRLAGGNDRLITALARPLGSAIQLESILVSVSQHGNGIMATVRRPGGEVSTLSADYLIVTLPATALRVVTFDPPLPPSQRDAIAGLAYGSATKVLLQFSQAFWRRAGYPRAFGSDLPTGAVWDGNEEQSGRQGILSILAGGSASRETQKILSERGVEGLVQALNWLRINPSRPSPRLLSYHVTVWEDDPWAQGGYAYFRTGYDPTQRGLLAQAHGRVLFAGEHTSCRWQGYMNGAVESGLRAAAEIQMLHKTAEV